jgi:[acyl-carrier-protein] S-malonyltransferase
VTVAAWVDGAPVPVAEVESRLHRLRERDLAAALPSPDTREGRQLRRWVAQVAVVERVCAAELAVREVSAETATSTSSSESPWPAGTPSPSEAAALGSIIAAAWANERAVARTAAAVTANVHLPGPVAARSARLAATSDEAPVWSSEQLLVAARLDAFVRWLAATMKDRVRLEQGYEHPGNSAQPDHLHEH